LRVGLVIIDIVLVHLGLVVNLKIGLVQRVLGIKSRVNLKMGQIKNEFILIIVVWFTIVCELVHLKIGIKSRVHLQIAIGLHYFDG